MFVDEDRNGDLIWHPWHFTFAIIGIVVAAFVLTWTFAGLNFALKVATATLYGRGEAHIEIQSAPFRIEAYQSFFNQCASIQGLEGQIDELTAQLAQQEPGTRAYNLSLSSLTGTKGLRHSAIAKYNQDALKDYTEGQFRDRDLPYQLVDNEYPPGGESIAPNGGKTVCAVQ